MSASVLPLVGVVTQSLQRLVGEEPTRNAHVGGEVLHRLETPLRHGDPAYSFENLIGIEGLRNYSENPLSLAGAAGRVPPRPAREGLHGRSFSAACSLWAPSNAIAAVARYHKRISSKLR